MVILLIALATTSLSKIVLYAVAFIFVVALLWYLIDHIVPEPLKKFGLAIVVTLAVLVLIYFIVQLANTGHIQF